MNTDVKMASGCRQTSSFSVSPFPRFPLAFNPDPDALHTQIHMRYSVSHHKLKLILSGQGIKPGDAGAIDALFGGADGYYWYGTVRDMCPEGKTLSWDNQYAMVNAIQAHEDATAEEDGMKAQKPTPGHIAALSKLLADPI